MVYKDKNLMLEIFQIVTPCLKNLDNSQKLALIPSLYRNHFSRKEGY